MKSDDDVKSNATITKLLIVEDDVQDYLGILDMICAINEDNSLNLNVQAYPENEASMLSFRDLIRNSIKASNRKSALKNAEDKLRVSNFIPDAVVVDLDIVDGFDRYNGIEFLDDLIQSSFKDQVGISYFVYSNKLEDREFRKSKDRSIHSSESIKKVGEMTKRDNMNFAGEDKHHYTEFANNILLCLSGISSEFNKMKPRVD